METGNRYKSVYNGKKHGKKKKPAKDKVILYLPTGKGKDDLREGLDELKNDHSADSVQCSTSKDLENLPIEKLAHRKKLYIYGHSGVTKDRKPLQVQDREIGNIKAKTLSNTLNKAAEYNDTLKVKLLSCFTGCGIDEDFDASKAQSSDFESSKYGGKYKTSLRSYLSSGVQKATGNKLKITAPKGAYNTNGKVAKPEMYYKHGDECDTIKGAYFSNKKDAFEKSFTSDNKEESKSCTPVRKKKVKKQGKSRSR